MSEEFNCNFCGKHKDGVAKLIAGPGVNICNECVDLCHAILVGDPVVPNENLIGNLEMKIIGLEARINAVIQLLGSPLE